MARRRRKRRVRTPVPPIPQLQVRFRDGSWRIDGDNLPGDLSFPSQLDAERLALGLARRRGLAVEIFDQTHRLLHRYA